ncbi:MAG: hypothetical protein CXR31_06900 [Geobacter sp.]|nr:MAG: hypothetical protein CXR31_06900 [Geobacter sp.]
MHQHKNIFYTLFIVILLATEFYYIDVFGGALRVYHFLALFVILLLNRFIPRLPITGLFWALFWFLSVNALAAAFADIPSEAFKSLGLLAANMSIAIAVALILISERLNLEQVIRIALAVAVAGVVFGIVQVAAFKLGGLNLGLSESQQGQITGGFAPGFRTEANSFAKNLNVVFLLTVPTLLTYARKATSLFVGGILVMGMLISFTRSALYGLLVTLFIYYLWSVLSRRRRLFAKGPVIFLGLAGICLAVFVSTSGQFNEYATHKAATFFDSEEVLHGDSSAFRLESQGRLLHAFLDSGKTFLIGNGWGQVRFFAYDREWQAGGAESVTALGYAGILGGIFYFLYQLIAINTVRQAVLCQRSTSPSRFQEGLLLALVGVLVTGQINGSLLAPEYWMLFGMAIACAYKHRCEVIANEELGRQYAMPNV